ncbi:PIN domain-containing protein [uncultured Desulfobulbus sp.]|uniref:type II toxin-antitoxin system VapC family toxin n=1 Tax=uncultured Desulfobulbus sp. TaxID=239745 RepID=UPI0029C96117|nr:PIN domain-containing protein [uncultured Desulfobulbus sp.]
MNADYVFIDTGAFIALSATRDKYHKSAVKIYSELLDTHSNLLTTNHILDEVYNYLLWDNTLGHKAAVKFGNMIYDVSSPVYLGTEICDLPISANLIIVYSTHEIEKRAWEIFNQYNTAGFSFTDCVSFAVMQKLGMKKSFSFDHHFDILSFERL